MKTLFIHLFFFAFIFHASAHPPVGINKLLNPLKRLSWTIGLSGIVVDDDGKPFKDLFDVKNSWDFLYIPSRVTLEGALIKGWSVELSMAYSRLKAGKTISDNNYRRPQDVNLYTVDVNAKYYPVKLISKFLSPYAIAGIGYTNQAAMDHTNGFMANLGLGLSVWVYKGFGVNVQSMAKFAVNTNASNYLMHSLGIVYRFKL